MTSDEEEGGGNPRLQGAATKVHQEEPSTGVGRQIAPDDRSSYAVGRLDAPYG